MNKKWNVCILGLSITSSWGNGHATTFRSLVKELSRLGHQVNFLERDVPWYASQRDVTESDHCAIHLYNNLDELKNRFLQIIEEADLVILGSYVPEGVEVGKWIQQISTGVTAFYDIDTPITLEKLKKEDYEYLHPSLIPLFDLYLSFSGGPVLEFIEGFYNSPSAKPFYCSVDTDLYYPEYSSPAFDLGYLGTYSDDRQPPLERLLIEPAKKWSDGKFAVIGPQYPKDIKWPANVYRNDHLPPAKHREFYNLQRFTLNVTRSAMVSWGYSPSVRLFEAAACAVPIISDYWEGLDTFFTHEQEILIAHHADDVLQYLHEVDEEERIRIGEKARQKILAHHTASVRAKQLIDYAETAWQKKNSLSFINK